MKHFLADLPNFVPAGGGGGATATLLTSGVVNGSDSINVRTFTTASISPGANCWLVLLIGTMNRNHTSGQFGGDDVDSSGSGPDTWTEEVSYDPSANYTPKCAIYTAAIGGSDPGSFTVTWSSDTTTDVAPLLYALYKVTGLNATTPFAGGVAANGVTDGAGTHTLAATPDADDIVLALSYADSNNAVGAAFSNSARTWTENVDFAGGGQTYTGGNAGQSTGSTSTTVGWSDVKEGETSSWATCQCAIICKAA